MDKEKDREYLEIHYEEYEHRQKKIRKQKKREREQEQWEEMLDELPEDVQAIMKKVK